MPRPLRLLFHLLATGLLVFLILWVVEATVTTVVGSAFDLLAVRPAVRAFAGFVVGLGIARIYRHPLFFIGGGLGALAYALYLHEPWMVVPVAVGLFAGQRLGMHVQARLNPPPRTPRD